MQRVLKIYVGCFFDILSFLWQLESWRLKFLLDIGALVCHQNPENIVVINDCSMWLCFRCLGFYTGCLFGAFFYLIVKKRAKLSNGGLCVVFFLLAACFVHAVFMCDLKQLQGNSYKFIFGFLAGGGLGTLLAALLLNRRLQEKRVVTKTILIYKRLLCVILFCFLTAPAYVGIDTQFMIAVFNLISFSGFAFLWLSVNYLMIDNLFVMVSSIAFVKWSLVVMLLFVEGVVFCALK